MATSPHTKSNTEQLEFGILAAEISAQKLPAKADAEALAASLVKRFVRHFQRMRDPAMLLSGDDSGLKNVWDEICVQKQAFESTDWRTHQRMIELVACVTVDELGATEKQTLWVLTESGWSWLYDVSRGIEPNEKEAIPIDDDLVQLLATRTLSYAADYSNVRIRKYLDRAC